MALRYLEADKVTLPSHAPLFVESGHCQWCQKELVGRQKFYCCERCTLSFYHYWIHRPAYVRATLMRDNFTCQKCGAHPMLEDKPWLPDISKLEADHIIPLARGGETEMGNLQTLCKGCNRKKGTLLEGEVRDEYQRAEVDPRQGKFAFALEG